MQLKTGVRFSYYLLLIAKLQHFQSLLLFFLVVLKVSYRNNELKKKYLKLKYFIMASINMYPVQFGVVFCVRKIVINYCYRCNYSRGN